MLDLSPKIHIWGSQVHPSNGIGKWAGRAALVSCVKNSWTLFALVICQDCLDQPHPSESWRNAQFGTCFPSFVSGQGADTDLPAVIHASVTYVLDDYKTFPSHRCLGSFLCWCQRHGVISGAQTKIAHCTKAMWAVLTTSSPLTPPPRFMASNDLRVTYLDQAKAKGPNSTNKAFSTLISYLYGQPAKSFQDQYETYSGMSFTGHENQNYKHTHLCVVQKRKNVFKQKKCMVVMTKTEKLVAFPSPLMEVPSLTQVTYVLELWFPQRTAPHVFQCAQQVSASSTSHLFLDG